jgi:hypothetical protein
LPSTKDDHTRPSLSFTPSYEYSSPSFYPYYPPQAASGYMSQYYPVMAAPGGGGEMTYPTAAYAPAFGYDGAAGYSPYHILPTHPHSSSAATQGARHSRSLLIDSDATSDDPSTLASML